MRFISEAYSLTKEEIKKDRSTVRRFGPCGVGEQAIYIGGILLDRWYCAPVSGISRVWKRIAMSKGGFTGKGAFGSLPYLVVQMRDGTEKICRFKDETSLDAMLEEIGKRHPGIPLRSAEAQKRLDAARLERERRKKKDLSKEAQETLTALVKEKRNLERDPFTFRELSDAAAHMRSFQLTRGSYGWVALIITLLGVFAIIYGVRMILTHGVSLTGGEGLEAFGIFFVLFGLAAIFLFAGLSVLPTAKNNRKAVEKRVETSVTHMKEFRDKHGRFTDIPDCYAHPVLIDWMMREVEEGNAETVPEALECVKKRLKALNSSVTVDREEYEEVLQIKPMFLIRDL